MPTRECRCIIKAVAAYHVVRLYADAISRLAWIGVGPTFPGKVRLSRA